MLSSVSRKLAYSQVATRTATNSAVRCLSAATGSGNWISDCSLDQLVHEKMDPVTQPVLF